MFLVIPLGSVWNKQTNKMQKTKVKHHIYFSTHPLNKHDFWSWQYKHTPQYQTPLMHCSVISIKTQVNGFRRAPAEYTPMQLASCSTDIWDEYPNPPSRNSAGCSEWTPQAEWREEQSAPAFHSGASASDCRLSYFCIELARIRGAYPGSSIPHNQLKSFHTQAVLGSSTTTSCPVKLRSTYPARPEMDLCKALSYVSAPTADAACL